MTKVFWLRGFWLLLMVGCSATSRPGNNAHPSATMSDRATAMIFVRVDCPISNGYAPELNRIMHDYANSDVNFELVYVDESLSLDQAKQHAAEFGYHCPVLVDANRKLVSELKITVTPEVSIVSRTGELLYHGRIDDTYAAFGQKRFAPTTHDLRDALDAIVHDRAVAVSSTVAVGCTIQ